MNRIKFNLFKLTTLLLFLVVFVNINYMGLIYNYFVYAFLGIIAIFIVSKIKVIFSQNILINIMAIVFGVAAIFSSILTKDFPQIIRALVFAVKVVETVLFFNYCYITNKSQFVLKRYLAYSLIFIAINDITMILFPSALLKFNNYFVGNKFSVCFLHLFSISLMLSLYNERLQVKHIIKEKCFVMLLFIVSLFTSIFVDCNTGTIGLLLVFCFIFFYRKHNNTLFRIRTFLLFLLASTSIIFFLSSILKNNFIGYLLDNVFDRDITLSGRTNIYVNVMPIIKEKIWFGYGYGNIYKMLMDKIGAADAQNGILQNILYYGVFGTTFLIALFCLILKKIEINNSKNAFPMICFIYTLLILSSIEITIGLGFLGYLSIAMMISKNENIERRI